LNYEEIKAQFFEHAEGWICDSYSWGFSYLAVRNDKEFLIIDSLLHVTPLPPINVKSFSIEAGTLFAGREIIPSLPKEKILKLLSKAANGQLSANGLNLKLQLTTPSEYYSNIPHRDTWYSDLHLQVSGTKLSPPPIEETIANDHALRSGSLPFDGLSDLGLVLQLSDSRVNGQSPKINIHLGPPVDILFGETTLRSNRLRLTLNAHPKFNLEKIGLAIREFPGHELDTRNQMAQEIVWSRAKNGVRKGMPDVVLKNADSALAMLTIGLRTARRQWFLDPDKALNSRYVSTQLFDKELRQLRLSVMEPTDSDRFERGIASLLFLLGFSSAIQVETQAPDIIATTIGGKLALIECTLKISDFPNKLGKLVDRRNALKRTLEANGHALNVSAFLICALPRAQVAVDDSQLSQHQVSLLCKEELAQAFDQLRIPKDPDEMLNRAATKLNDRKRNLA
jgi:hypothetical protein